MNTSYYGTPPTSDEIMHFGVKGMRWGVRRYVDTDGKLTPEGKKRYFSKKGKMKLRGWVLRRNLDDFDNILRKHATADLGESERMHKKYKELEKWAKNNHVNENDYVSAHLRDRYLKTGKWDYDDPSGHKLSYRKKVVEYSNKWDKLSDESSKIFAKNRDYANRLYRDKLQFGKYTLQDYERDVERKKK